MEVYILDEANGMYATLRNTKIPRMVYIGPFEDEAKAFAYLANMTNFDIGEIVPEGYAIIKVVQPLNIPGPDCHKKPFLLFKEPRKLKFDDKLRYEQAPKKKLRRKRK